MRSWRGSISASNARTRRSNSQLDLMPSTHIGSKLNSYSSAFLLIIVVVPFSTFVRSRQTVFYTVDAITINEGGIVNGTITCAPNQRNNRDLDISITYETDENQSGSLSYKMCVISLSCSVYSCPSLSRNIIDWIVRA